MRGAWIIIGFAAIVAVLGIGLTLNPREMPSLSSARRRPMSTCRCSMIRRRTFLRGEMAGRVWMLNVWASWCPPCLEEHPVITELAKSGAAPVVGLNYKDGREDALAWLKRNGDPFIVSAHDPAG